VVETRDAFHLLPVDSSAGEVDPENLQAVIFKPAETPVTLAAKRSYLGQVYLDWAKHPLVTAEELEGGRHQVQFEDLRFESVEGAANRRRPPLAGYVVLDPQLRVEEMYVGRPPKQSGGTR
jgi:inner membrane protein